MTESLGTEGSRQKLGCEVEVTEDDYLQYAKARGGVLITGATCSMQGLSPTRGSAHATPSRDLTFGVVQLTRAERGTPSLPRGLREVTKERSRAPPTAVESHGAYTLAVRGTHGGVGTEKPLRRAAAVVSGPVTGLVLVMPLPLPLPTLRLLP